MGNLTAAAPHYLAVLESEDVSLHIRQHALARALHVYNVLKDGSKVLEIADKWGPLAKGAPLIEESTEVEKAMVFHRKGATREAISMIEAVLSKFPRDSLKQAWALERLSLMNFRLQDYDAAIRWGLQALANPSLTPNPYGNVCFWLALSYKSLGKYTEAAQYLSRVMKQTPQEKATLSHALQGELALLGEDYETALAHYRSAIRAGDFTTMPEAFIRNRMVGLEETLRSQQMAEQKKAAKRKEGSSESGGSESDEEASETRTRSEDMEIIVRSKGMKNDSFEVVYAGSEVEELCEGYLDPRNTTAEAKKFRRIYAQLLVDPTVGDGRRHRLPHTGGEWSRKLTGGHRVKYSITGRTVRIRTAHGHDS